MQRKLVALNWRVLHWALFVVLGVMPNVATAQSSGRSLTKCQRTVGEFTTRYATFVQAAVTRCLDRIAAETIAGVDPASDAARSCALALRKIDNSENATRTLSARFREKVSRACDPAAMSSIARHTPPEVLDPNAIGGLQAGLLASYCDGFGGDGPLDSVGEWIACADSGAVCSALQQVAVEYPRAAQWLGEISTAILALDPTDPKYIDAAGVAASIRSQIDSDADGVADIACGPLSTRASGDATAAEVLLGRTFSNDDGAGQIGTMPNRGGVVLTPGASDHEIAAGYHDGSGYCAGDEDLVAANVRSGVDLFGVTGESNVVDTSSGDAAASDVAAGKTAWVDGLEVAGTALLASGDAIANDVLAGKTFSNASAAGVTGTMTNVGQQTITPGVDAVTITNGYHDGTGEVAGDEDLIAANIAAGVEMFGVTGTLEPGCGNGVVDTGESCDGSDLNGESCASFGYADAGALTCTNECQLDLSGCELNFLTKVSRFRDNGDGTATDIASGLQWEIKDSLDSVPDPNNVHDADNTYTWSLASPWDFDGTAASVFLATLNNAPCFAGYCDWRLPTINELESLFVSKSDYDNYFDPNDPNAPTVQVDVDLPGDTQANDYWSSTSTANLATNAFVAAFDRGALPNVEKTRSLFVRAIRGGL